MFSSVSFQLLDHRDFITPDGALYIDMLFSTEDPVLDPVFCKRFLQSVSDILSRRAMKMSFIEKLRNFEV